MEQVKQLLEILSQTPEMALWGLGMYFAYILLKAASWITAIALIAKLFIRRFFNYKDAKVKMFEAKKIEIKEKELQLSIANEILNYFERHSISSVGKMTLMKVIDAMRKDDSYKYIHDEDIEKAVKAINKYKKDS